MTINQSRQRFDFSIKQKNQLKGHRSKFVKTDFILVKNNSKQNRIWEYPEEKDVVELEDKLCNIQFENKEIDNESMDDFNDSFVNGNSISQNKSDISKMNNFAIQINNNNNNNNSIKQFSNGKDGQNVFQSSKAIPDSMNNFKDMNWGQKSSHGKILMD